MAKHARPSMMRRAARIARSAAVPGIGAVSLAVTAAPPHATAPPAVNALMAARTLEQHAVITDDTVTAVPVAYRVRPGDTLTKIAQDACGNPADWTGIYHANRARIADPDVIYPGQRLKLDCRQVKIAFSGQRARRPDQDSPSGNKDISAHVNPGDYSGFQGCVIARESGGNPDAWNASGHWGLYQFAYETWVKAGGDPALFGHADAAYQTEIFWKAYTLWGTSPWSYSDGC